MNKRIITSLMLFLSVIAVTMSSVTDFGSCNYRLVKAEESKERVETKKGTHQVQEPSIKLADEVINHLMKGNEKYIKSNCNDSNIGKEVRQKLLKDGQHPYAVVVGCTDSRVVPEDIFNLGLGEILVSRGVGNVVDDTILGTVEFGVDYMKVPVVMVLGHQKCGAVGEAKEGYSKGNLGKLIKQIIPLYNEAKTQGGTEDEIYERAVELNVRNSVDLIKNAPNIKEYVESNKVKVVGAVYSQETGAVRLIN